MRALVRLDRWVAYVVNGGPLAIKVDGAVALTAFTDLKQAELFEEHARRTAQGGVSVTTIGVGLHFNEDVLTAMDSSDELRVRLEFEEDTAGEAMTSKFVAVLDDWNVRTATRAVRKMAAEIESIYEVYVVNEARQLVGIAMRPRTMWRSGILMAGSIFCSSSASPNSSSSSEPVSIWV